LSAQTLDSENSVPNLRPWLYEPPLPRVEADTDPKSVRLRHNKLQTYSKSGDGVYKWTPVGGSVIAKWIDSVEPRSSGRGTRQAPDTNGGTRQLLPSDMQTAVFTLHEPVVPEHATTTSTSLSKGKDSEREQTALQHHALRTSWVKTEAGRALKPSDHTGLG
jgi:hypothetical protein